MLELAGLADDAALAVRLDRRPERRLGAVGQLLAEDLAEVDQLGQVVRVRARVRVLHDRGDRDAAQWARERLAALLVELLDERRPLADRDRHAGPSSSIGRV